MVQKLFTIIEQTKHISGGPKYMGDSGDGSMRSHDGWIYFVLYKLLDLLNSQHVYLFFLFKMKWVNLFF